MNSTYKPEQFPFDLLNKLVTKCSAIFHINKINKSYEQIYANDEISSVCPKTGTLYDMYKTFFASNKAGQNYTQNKYNIFFNEDMFTRENYSGNLIMQISEKEKDFDYRIVSLDETITIFFLIENDFRSEDIQYERMKMETIQENFLFSMIVDLKNDKCINSNTTELSSNDQNYLDVSYSAWREMIVNMFLPEDQRIFMNLSAPENIIRQLERNKQFKYEIKMLNMHGEFIWTRLNFNRMKDFSRENPIFVYTVQDIHDDMTRLLQQENIIAAIEAKNQQLSDINKSQNTFISNMSHEIRTPINAVLGLDEMIIRETDDENILNYAQDIKIAGKMLLNTINDILDYSKIEAGKIEIIPVEYNLETIISDINTIIIPKAAEKNLNYNIKVNENIPRTLYGDEIRIKQIIINLLTNAVKYTEKGGLLWKIDYEEIDNQSIALKISVKDSGIGLKEEDIEKLFTAFTRLDEKRNRNIEGTGLGMSIVTRLLDQMNSKLEVESVYEKGSTFSFVLQQTVVDKTPIGDIFTKKKKISQEKTAENFVHSPSARILIVDDNKVNLTVMKGLLKRSEAKVDGVQSGQECLDKLQAGNTYDLILLDHFMPEMDGIETLQNIRKLGFDYNSMPVIALTANVESNSKEQYLNLGFNDFLEKPVVISDLESILCEYLQEYTIK